MKDPRQVADHLFSRGVLGSILVGVAIGKVVEKAVILATPDNTLATLGGWIVATAVFVAMYLHWATFEDTVDDVTDEYVGDGDE